MYRFLLICWSLVSVSFGQCPHELSGLRDWSDVAGWPDNELPSADEDVTITDAVLLDISPPRLKRVIISSTGKLVFSPDVDKVHLQAKNILVEGEMHIGAENCRFSGNAEITLYGKKEPNSANIPGFNQKFIGVPSGGLLEIHGEEKRSWTKLSNTIDKGSTDTIMEVKADRAFFPKAGYVISYMDPNDISNTLQTVTIRTDCTGPAKAAIEASTAVTTMSNIPNGNIVFIGVRRSALNSATFSAFYDEVEKLGWGSVTQTSKLRSLESEESYVFYAKKGDTSQTIERFTENDDDEDIIETDEFIDDLVGVGGNQWRIDLISSTNKVNTGQSYVLFRITDYDIAYPVVDVIDDISSWNAGDVVVFASTDYSFKQAETAEIKSVVNNNRFRITKGLEFSHYGEINNQVDMRGEIGMLTHNVVIHGEVEDDCPTDENGNCAEFDYDTFGAHLKAVNGFKSFRIQGAELYNVGQQPVLGSYPLHYHLCGDLAGYTIPQYWKSNSIHNSFSRCTTVHGTQNAVVSDIVCYEFLGHGFFMEDGCESGATFDGNLGLSAMDGSLLPTDKTPATFWITSPKATVTNNAAGGGQAYGYWFVYPIGPTGPSAGNPNCIPAGQAQYTPITEFNNNVAHSNNMDGVFIDKQLDANQTLIGTNSYKPVSDPSDPNSDDVKVAVSDLTSYKNKRRNFWIKGGYFEVDNVKSSDSPVGIAIVRQDSTDQEQILSNSVIIGESDNVGTGDFSWESTVGLVLTNGPLYVNKVFFDGFHGTVSKPAAAISWSDAKPSPILWVSEASFGSNQNSDYIIRDSAPTGSIYDDMRTMYDVDGSVTGAGVASTVVIDLPFHKTSVCTTQSAWEDLAICPYRYAQVRVNDVTNGNSGSTIPTFTRTHYTESTETFTSNFDSGDAPFNVILGGQFLYKLDWSNGVPTKFKIKPLGVDRDNWVIVGAQVGVSASFSINLANPRVNKNEWTSVNDLTALAATTSQGSYYYDSSNGYLYFKLFTEDARTADETDMCPGGDCPIVTVTIETARRGIQKEVEMDEEEAIANKREYLLKEILRVLENKQAEEKRDDPYKSTIQKMLRGNHRNGESQRSNIDEGKRILEKGNAEKKRGNSYKTTLLKRGQGILGNSKSRRFYIDEIRETKSDGSRRKRSAASPLADTLNIAK